MAEVMEQKELSPAGAEPVVEKKSLKEKWKAIPRKKRRRAIRWIVVLAVLAAIGFGAWKLLGNKSEPEMQAVTDVVQYGSITSTVEGSGLTKAKNSESITLATAGVVQEVFVTEGQQVNAGDPLFIVDSESARTAVEKARSDLEGLQKQMSALQKDIAGLNLAPTYPGKLMDTVKLNPGDTISKGEKVATLADDTKLRLTQYYSYAYEGLITAGQSVEVSIPALMTSVTGTVEQVHMVSRVTAEGSRLFSAEIVLENPGTLTAGMTASATVTAGGETAYPYETGSLEYNRVGDLCSTVNGTVISSALVDYLQVSAGQVLVRIDGEDSEGEIFALQERIDNAQKELESAEKNLANCEAVASISGTVMGLMLSPGMEVEANTAAVTIADTSTIIVDATVDERNVSYVKPGAYVEVNQWDTVYSGVVESLSLNSQAENGVARYPMVISVDNYDGTLMTGSYINYSMVASQNDNCLVVPIQCVRTVTMPDGSAGDVVFVQGDRPENAIDLEMPVDGVPEGFWAVPVETGIADDYYVEIKSGVEADTVVFTQMMTTEFWM
ncbi:MAG: HlyD family efflux transporter periplasmic adaptor subunit [Oscillospiraceae bacterium]|nr:HlyD family efflux transporter periplasmic adaptor subunit [Oscillospiraceae bacterium]